MPSVEFTIDGAPLSAQAKDQQLRARYRDRVQDAARAAMGSMTPFQDPVRLTLRVYSEGWVRLPDGDNAVKPVKDALQGIVYPNDSRVHDELVIRRCTDEPFVIVGAPRVLVEKLTDGIPFFYVHVTTEIRREVIT